MPEKKTTKEVLNEILEDIFHFILYIQEKNLKEKGVSLSMTEVHLLDKVSKAKNNTVTSIADDLLITKGTFSINASRLIKKGYLTKYKDEDDGRIVRVEITEKAKDILLVHDRFHENLINCALENLNIEQNKVLNTGLGSILSYLKQDYARLYEKKI